MRIAIVALCFLTTGCAGAVSRDGCRQAVNDAVLQAGVAPGEVTDVAVATERSSGEDGQFLGYSYWHRLQQCGAGYLMVETDFACRVTQTYTTGECRLSGVPHY